MTLIEVMGKFSEALMNRNSAAAVEAAIQDLVETLNATYVAHPVVEAAPAATAAQPEASDESQSTVSQGDKASPAQAGVAAEAGHGSATSADF
jgi:hypothetical protein